ncbi:DNA replication protein DnaC [Rhizobium leguminosarum]|nr:DNA replication protein DnaC [Rhizobium leguminosarum]
MAAYQLLTIDELGFVPLSKIGAELLFELISQRYERGVRGDKQGETRLILIVAL